MVTSPYEWKILEWDENPQTNFYIRLCEQEMLNRVQYDNVSRYIPNTVLFSSLSITDSISLSFFALSSMFSLVRISIQ